MDSAIRNGQPPVALPNLNGYNCFCCGSKNPIGFKMRFFADKDRVFSDVVLTENHAGWEHLTHGGLLATLLDETMGWALLTFIRKFAVTRKMEVRYLRPVPVGHHVRVEGRVTETRESGVSLSGTLFGPDGRKSVIAYSDMVFVSQKRLDEAPQPFLQDTMELFSRMEETLRGAGLL
ncbi:MAG: PaaI family thioesterase [Thermodesulfobacteriota bacterium]